MINIAYKLLGLFDGKMGFATIDQNDNIISSRDKTMERQNEMRILNCKKRSQKICGRIEEKIAIKNEMIQQLEEEPIPLAEDGRNALRANYEAQKNRHRNLETAADVRKSLNQLHKSLEREQKEAKDRLEKLMLKIELERSIYELACKNVLRKGMYA